ncbi:MAG: response regulator [Lachnospiraceae bacterium]|nr:response regulator [Lachnospiraceae bacterium]
MTEGKKNKQYNILNFIAAAVIILFFTGVIAAYYYMLRKATENNIVKSVELNAGSAADRIDGYLSTGIDSILLSAYALENMMRNDRSNEDMVDYLVDETSAIFELLPESSTGLYGVVNGEYMDGGGWVPDEDYVPQDRPWYKQALTDAGRVAVVDPYIDAQTGEVMITFTKMLFDKKSVIAVDLSMERLQKITEEVVTGETGSFEIILDRNFNVIAHSDRTEVGKSYRDEKDTFGAAVLDAYLSNKSNYFSLEYDGTEYIIYAIPLENSWLCLSINDATDEYNRLRRPLILTILAAITFITIVVIITVNSARKNRQTRKLELEAESAVAANQAKSSFLSNMSHEIRTPINAVLGMNEMILRESDDTAVRDYANSIRNAGQTLLGLINDILDFSRIEEGRLEIIPVDYDLARMLCELVTMVRQRADDKGLELKLDFDRKIPRHLRGDEIRIRQVITNILTNAVKYTETGSVTLRVGYEKDPDDAGGILLKVEVKDTGIGIRPEDIKKLFMKFERIEEERNRNVEGAGLGLNITENLLGLMGSHLEVQSIYGEGSTFGFRLPQRVTDWKELGDYTDFEQESCEKEKPMKKCFTAPTAAVLAVDDNQVNLMVFESLVKRIQMKIDTAKSGDECIAMTRRKKYDIIFLDYMMPKKNGIETLHELKAEETNQNVNTPTVCLTANAVRGAKEECLNAGFDGYISKPVDPDKLDEMIRSFLPKNKIVEAETEEVREEPVDEELKAQLDKLRSLHLDVDAGIKNSGSPEGYKTLLEVFCRSVDQKIEELNASCSEETIDDYTIKVHALKSTARIIGAEHLARAAEMLESAGKNEDFDYIKKNHAQAMKEFAELKDPIASAVIPDESPESERDDADETMMSDVFAEIRAAAESMDCQTLEQIFKEMHKYRIPEDETELWEKLKGAAERYEYESILELLNYAESGK